MSGPQLSKDALLEQADKLLPTYRAAIETVPPEAGFGGIWESEMFLFYAAVRPFSPRQILESGRARGKSTLILARCFPDAHIISVEVNSTATNAAIAEAKLKPYRNVELLYGDSRNLFAPRLERGDAVLIDGPKHFRALKLALELLETGKPCSVFVHDFPADSAARRFVRQNWPGAFFGDDPSFERFRALDEGRDPLEGTRRRRYGIFACFPAHLPAPAWALRLKMILARTLFSPH